MKRLILPFAILTLANCTSPTPAEQEQFDESRIELPLWDENIALMVHIADKNDPVLFLNVHEDETTSISALRNYSKDHDLNYLFLTHNGERRISYTIDDEQYSIDPNRMFTNQGRKKTLEDGENYSLTADLALKGFANRFLKETKAAKVIVAMHNNTNDNYSIQSYLPEGDEAQNTDKLYINPEMDPDDFIYTTDAEIYVALMEKNINVILQDNKNFVDDGSLSVYCGINNIRYINLETEHGHLKQQLKFMALIGSILEE